LRCVVPAGWLAGGPVAAEEAKPEPKPLKLTTTADHTKFKELQKQFNSGPEVTKACLACHTEAAGQIHRTKHWKWEYMNPETKQTLGKKTILNNFCISIPRTTRPAPACHVGYGWKDANFDFKSEENVDCLACHDTTGNYKKPPGLAGNVVPRTWNSRPASGKIVKAIDLGQDRPEGRQDQPRHLRRLPLQRRRRRRCQARRHGQFAGAPTKDLDVHMDADGLDFTCGTCHATSGHDVARQPLRADRARTRRGRPHARQEGQGQPATCVACHGNGPHPASKEARLNHTRQDRLPDLPHPELRPWRHRHQDDLGLVHRRQARRRGQAHRQEGRKGPHHYESRKGDFTLAENVKPEYAWFNGNVQYTLLSDKIEKTEQRTRSTRWAAARRRQVDDLADEGVPRFAALRPGEQDPDHAAHRRQRRHRLLEEPRLGQGDSGRHEGFRRALSGKFDFIKTEMSWPITHMVAPKEKALGCVECHSKDGRLAGIQGVYLPARDNNKLVDTAGWAIVLLTLLGVIGHGTLRFVTRGKH
jgi:hypothetical protein